MIMEFFLLWFVFVLFLCDSLPYRSPKEKPYRTIKRPHREGRLKRKDVRRAIKETRKYLDKQKAELGAYKAQPITSEKIGWTQEDVDDLQSLYLTDQHDMLSKLATDLNRTLPNVKSKLHQLGLLPIPGQIA